MKDLNNLAAILFLVIGFALFTGAAVVTALGHPFPATQALGGLLSVFGFGLMTGLNEGRKGH